MKGDIIHTGIIAVGTAYVPIPLRGKNPVQLIIAPDSTNTGDIYISKNDKQAIASTFKLEGALSEEINPENALYIASLAATQVVNIMLIQK